MALAIEPLFVANWLAQAKLFSWSILSLDGLSVRASNGMHLPVDGALGEIGTYQTVFVVASFNVKAYAEDQRLLNWLRRMARFGADMGAIETGSEVLAAANLLDGHPAAVHWDNLEGFRERYPDVTASAQLYTIGNGRMTCAGATSILDMMLGWIGIQAEPDWPRKWRSISSSAGSGRRIRNRMHRKRGRRRLEPEGAARVAADAGHDR